MKRPLASVKSVLATGLFIVVPAYLAFLLLGMLFTKLGAMMKPISKSLPEGVNHPSMVAFLVLLAASFAAGLFVQTRIGRKVNEAVTQTVFERIPGYSAMNAIARQMADFQSSEGFKPALIDVEDHCLSPAFLIEDHGDGRCTVFMPSVPTPMAGTIFIMARERVFPIDVPLPVMMNCITKWGSGSGALLAAHDAAGNKRPA